MRQGRRIGAYEVVGELARGATGVVLHVRRAGSAGDAADLALKLLLDFPPESSARRRFLREAEALRRLQHPHVVKVRDSGFEHGRPFLVMDLVRGRSLSERLANHGPLTPQEAATLVRTLALAVHYVHEQGLLHRDLKPANVLLGDHGEPVLTDFGLALDLLRSDRLTRTGQFLGTPGFWAPETARAERERIGPRSDVYGLGAILYACLCGRPPFEGQLTELLQAVEHLPEPPSRFAPDLDPALEAVCLTCLQPRPEDRYSSARALADELSAFLSQPLEASQRRLSRPTVLAAASVLALGVGGAALVLGRQPPAGNTSAPQASATPTPGPNQEPSPTPSALRRSRFLREAGQLLGERRLTECLETLALMERLEPVPPVRLFLMRATCYTRLGQARLALEATNRGLQLHPGELRLLSKRSMIWHQLRNEERSTADARAAAAGEPHSADDYVALASALATLERYQEGLAACQQALDLAPGSEPALVAQVTCLVGLGDLEGAHGVVDELERLVPPASARQRDVAQLRRMVRAMERQRAAGRPIPD